MENPDLDIDLGRDPCSLVTPAARHSGFVRQAVAVAITDPVPSWFRGSKVSRSIIDTMYDNKCFVFFRLTY